MNLFILRSQRALLYAYEYNEGRELGLFLFLYFIMEGVEEKSIIKIRVSLD